MALSTRTDGLDTGSKVTHDWWDDYYDLLTGAMTDQSVTLNYRPGTGTTPTLLLKGDGSGPLVKGLKTDNSTTAFSIDSSGNLTLAGAGTSAGFNMVRMRVLGTGLTAGKQLWVVTDEGDPDAGDGLLEGDVVLQVATP